MGKVAKAQTAAKVAKKAITKKQTKVRKNVHFFRPKTLKQARKPMYPRVSVAKLQLMDKFRVIKYPLTTESAMKKIEELNTLVFIVDVKASKSDQECCRADVRCHHVEGEHADSP